MMAAKMNPAGHSSPHTAPQGKALVKQVEQASFEQALLALESAVERLESGELSLNDALRVFEEGARWSQRCQEHLSAAEARVEMVMKKYDGQVVLVKAEEALS